MKRDPLAAPPPAPLAPVDLADPIARKAWLHSVRGHVADITAAALEATGPKHRRILSRAEAWRTITEAGAMLMRELDAAGAIKPVDDDDEPEGPTEPDDPDYGGDCEFSTVLTRRRGDPAGSGGAGPTL